jgi:zinc D-Ala-D-Ala carboxypeptidase
VKARNQKTNQRVARIYSVKAFALVLALSLSALTSVGASAVESIDSASSYQVVVNKTRPLTPVTYRPSDLVKVPKYNPYARIVRRNVSAAIVLLGNDMKAAGQGTLIVQSGYRSYSSQTTIHRAKVRALGKVHGEKLAARPGYSEHQTGLAVDFAARGVSTLQVSFAKTKAGIWLAANAYRYGFVLRYPSGKTAITGYSFEPWHFRYVGVEVATAMHDQNIQTLEEFYALPAAPSYLN